MMKLVELSGTIEGISGGGGENLKLTVITKISETYNRA